MKKYAIRPDISDRPIDSPDLTLYTWNSLVIDEIWRSRYGGNRFGGT